MYLQHILVPYSGQLDSLVLVSSSCERVSVSGELGLEHGCGDSVRVRVRVWMW